MGENVAMGKKKIKIVFFQIFYCIILALIIWFFTWKKSPKDVLVEDIAQQFEEKYPECNLVRMDELKVKKIFGINASDYNGYLYYASEDMMTVDELFLIKIKEDNQKDSVISIIKDRIEKQKVIFNGYGTNQMDLLRNAVIFSSGKYVCLIVSQKPQEWLEMIKEIIRV